MYWLVAAKYDLDKGKEYSKAEQIFIFDGFELFTYELRIAPEQYVKCKHIFLHNYQ